MHNKKIIRYMTFSKVLITNQTSKIKEQYEQVTKVDVVHTTYMLSQAKRKETKVKYGYKVKKGLIRTFHQLDYQIDKETT